MKRVQILRRMAPWFIGGLIVKTVMLLCVFTTVGQAEEQETLKFDQAILLGRAGDQGVSWSGMGIAVNAKSIYLGTNDKDEAGGQALALRFGIPPEAPYRGSPVTWAFWSPNRRTSGGPEAEVFAGVVATEEGLYFAGRSAYLTEDGVGDKEAKAVLGKFYLTPPTGGDWGRPIWVAKPNFFSYRGNESFFTWARK